MTTTKNEIPPELVKIRDERCPSDLNFRKDCDENSFRCGAKISWKEGFNDAFHLGRKFERDELAEENDKLKLAISMLKSSHDRAIQQVEAHDFEQTISKQAWIDMQTEFKNRIAKLEDELTKTDKLYDELDEKFDKAIEALRFYSAIESWLPTEAYRENLRVIDADGSCDRGDYIYGGKLARKTLAEIAPEDGE